MVKVHDLREKKKTGQREINHDMPWGIITILSQTNDQIAEHKNSFGISFTSTAVYVVNVNRES